MSPFPTITSAHWKEAIARSRSAVNLISAQLKEYAYAFLSQRTFAPVHPAISVASLPRFGVGFQYRA